MLGSPRNNQRLIRGALGEIPVDTILTGGKLINVYSGEILEGWEVAILDGRICYVGPSAKHTRGEQTQILDVHGLCVSPGFIDGHTHIGHYARPFENLQSFLPCGTTALMASCDEFASVFGNRGMQFFLDEVERHPLRVYTLVSMTVPQDPLLCSTAAFTDEEIASALDDPRVLGLGEIVSWLRLLQCDEEILRRIELAQRGGQVIQGHTAGASDRKLCAVAATGVSSCHEPINIDDAIERLRLGFWTMLREGSLRQDLEETLKPLIERGIDLRRVILVTDSMTPDDIAEHGHMDNVVRRAIALGLSPLQAIQMVTLNPALYSGVEQDIGGIAPGRFADLAVIDDLEQCHIDRVIVSGKLVADNGVSLVDETPFAVPKDFFRSLSLGRSVSAQTFRIPCATQRANIRVMELLNQTITTERIMELSIARACVDADVENDLLKIAMFDRHSYAPVAFGFLKGFGARVGAVGLTVNLDENTLMIVGSDDADMALCANALVECGGGIAVCDRGQILEKLDLPGGGIFSLDPWRDVGRRFRRLQQSICERGSNFDKPMCPLIFLPFVTLPALRITARGLVNAKERRIVPLFAD